MSAGAKMRKRLSRLTIVHRRRRVPRADAAQSRSDQVPREKQAVLVMRTYPKRRVLTVVAEPSRINEKKRFGRAMGQTGTDFQRQKERTVGEIGV
jgi:hypothetical protein